MKTKSIAIISCLILFFGAAMTVSAQNGKFGVVGLRFYQESRDRFSFDGETNFPSVGVYGSLGKEYMMSSRWSISPYAQLSYTLMNYGGVPSSKVKSLIDLTVVAPINYKIPLKKEGRFFYFGAGPSATAVITDGLSNRRNFYCGVDFRFVWDISDKMFIGADANFGLTDRSKIKSTYDAFVNIGLGWKF